jgi:maltooligosyltrehalose synthase
MRRLLDIRREFAGLFRDGDYTPLRFDGADADRVIGFARSRKRQYILVIVGRHFSAPTDGGHHWPRGFDIRLKDKNLDDYRDMLGTKLSEGLLPVAVLAR